MGGLHQTHVDLHNEPAITRYDQSYASFGLLYFALASHFNELRMYHMTAPKTSTKSRTASRKQKSCINVCLGPGIDLVQKKLQILDPLIPQTNHNFLTEWDKWSERFCSWRFYWFWENHLDTTGIHWVVQAPKRCRRFAVVPSSTTTGEWFEGFAPVTTTLYIATDGPLL